MASLNSIGIRETSSQSLEDPKNENASPIYALAKRALLFGTSSGLSLIKASLITSNFEKEIDLELNRIIKLSPPSWHLSKFLHLVFQYVSPHLVKALLNYLQKSHADKSILNHFVNSQRTSLENYAIFIFLRLSGNLIQFYKNEEVRDKEEDVFLGTLAFFFRFLKQRLKPLQSELRALDGEVCEEAKRTKLEIIRPVSEEVLKMLAPEDHFELCPEKGVALKLLLAPYFWTFIKETGFPQLILILDQFFFGGLPLDKKEKEYLKLPGGELLLKAVQGTVDAFFTQINFGASPIFAQVINLGIKFILPNLSTSLIHDWVKTRVMRIHQVDPKAFQFVLSAIKKQITALIIKLSLAKIDPKKIKKEGSLYKFFLDSFVNRGEFSFDFLTSEDFLNKKIQSILEPLNSFSSHPKVMVEIFDLLKGISHSFCKFAEEQSRFFESEEQVKNQLCLALYNKEIFLDLAKEGSSNLFKEFLEEISEVKREAQKDRSRLFELTGTAKIVNEINKFFESLSKNAVSNLFNGDLIDLLSKSNEAILSKNEKKSFQELLKLLASSNDPSLISVRALLEKQTRLFFLRGLAILIEKTPDLLDEGESSKEFFLVNIFFYLIKLFEKRIGSLKDLFDEANPEEKKAAFINLSKDFTSWVLKEPETCENTLSNNMGAFLREIVETKVLPLVLEELLWHSSKKLLSMEDFDTELKSIYGTNYPSEAFHLLESFLLEFLPHLFRSRSEKISEFFIDVLLKNLKPISDFEPASKIVSENKPNLLAFLSKNFSRLGQLNEAITLPVEKSNTIKAGYSFFVRYVLYEGLPNFINFSHRFKLIDREIQNNSDFILPVVIRVLDLAADHFRHINKVTKRLNKKAAFDVTQTEMLLGFNVKVHPALSLDPKASSHEIDKIKLDKFYRPLTKNLFALCNSTKESLSVHPLLQGPIFKFVEEDLFPMILYEVLDSILKPAALDTFTARALSSVQKSFSLVIREAEKEEEDNLIEDEKQKELNRASGAFVLQLIELIPKTLGKSLFKSDKIKNLTAEKVGRSIRKLLLKKISLIESVNTTFRDGLALAHPGQFEGERENASFKTHRVKTHPNGETELEPCPPSFHFPKTEDAIKQKDAEDQKNSFEKEKELQRLMADTFMNQLETAFFGFIDKNWTKFQANLDQTIEKAFGHVGLKIKRILDLVFCLVFIKIIGTILKLIFLPFYKIFWGLLYLHALGKARDILQGMHMPVHESLFYKATEAIVEDFKKASLSKTL